MPKSWHFPRWRFFTMQVVMCSILAATIGLAGFVDYGLRKAQGNLLAEPTVDGELTFSLPTGWKILSHGNGTWSAHSPASKTEPARTITIHRQRVDRMMPTVHFLAQSGQLMGEAESVRPITIDDKWPGDLVQVSSVDLTSRANPETQSVVLCLMLPNFQAITVRLEKSGKMDTADIRLATLLLQSIKISGLAAPAAGPFDMEGGIKINLGPDYLVMPETDPLRTERFIFTESPSGKRVSAHLIPVMLPAAKPVDAMLSALSNDDMDTRDLNSLLWLESTVTPEAPDRWRIEPPQVENQLFVHRAYLLGKPGSQGLLISMQTDADSSEDLGSAWAAISAGVQFTQPRDLKALLAAGAPIAQSPDQMNALEETRYLLQRDGIAEGSIYNYTDLQHRVPVRETRRREWDGRITKVEERWGVNDNGLESTTMARTYANAEPGGPFYIMFQCLTHVSDVIRNDILITRQFPSESTPLTPDFVFSARFPALLATITDGPLAFTTDRFIGSEGDLLTRPIVLLLEKTDKYVQVEVNGSGRLSRWYFKQDHTLDHADFAGGLSLKPSNSAEIGALLPDSRLTPPR